MIRQLHQAKPDAVHIVDDIRKNALGDRYLWFDPITT
jgi:hypothetical protein